MALIFKTKDDLCRVYNDRGAESASPITVAGTVLTVTGGRVEIPNRGLCFPISAPRVGYVMESEVLIVEDAPPPTTGAIEGLVTDGSAPLDGVAVVAGGFSGTTDTAGAYRFENAPVGAYIMSFEKSGYVSQTGISVSVTAGQVTRKDATLTPIPPADIITADFALYDVKVSGDQYRALGITLTKVQ